jgi:hypothetical protein
MSPTDDAARAKAAAATEPKGKISAESEDDDEAEKVLLVDQCAVPSVLRTRAAEEKAATWRAGGIVEILSAVPKR